MVIPNSVTSIGYKAFEYCNLKSVTFKNTEGWMANDNDSYTLSSEDLSNVSTAAKYLENTYLSYTWTREE